MQPANKQCILALLTLPVLACLSGAQGPVVDLTKALVKRPTWKTVSSRSGGPVGNWPKSPSMRPISVHLLSPAIRGMDIYFSLKLENVSGLEIQVPTDTDPDRFVRAGVEARFRELLINIGMIENHSADFKSDPRIEAITLFGSPSVAGTMRMLSPHDSLILKVRVGVPSHDYDLGKLRVQIAGSDVMLAPANDGYREIREWVPSLFGTSQGPGMSESKLE